MVWKWEHFFMVICRYKSLYISVLHFESTSFYAESFQQAQCCFCCRSPLYQCPVVFKKVEFKGNCETFAAVWDDEKNLHSARKWRLSIAFASTPHPWRPDTCCGNGRTYGMLVNACWLWRIEKARESRGVRLKMASPSLKERLQQQ